MERALSFKQDNVPVHRANLTQLYLEISGIKSLPFPPQSPDLSPIKEVWQWLALKVKTRVFNKIRNLIDYIFNLWNEMPKSTILAL